MNYSYQNAGNFKAFNLPLIKINFKVDNMEEYETQDYPEKSGFNGSWREWTGVKINYILKDINTCVEGSRGKTTWYLPAKTEGVAKALNIEKGQSLKIIKYMVKDTLADEYIRLLEEYKIQKRLANEGLAAQIYDLVLVQNTSLNKVKWFDEIHQHPMDSIYFALIVEHIENEKLPEEKIKIDKDYMFYGSSINQIKECCKKLDIISYDLGLGNVLYSKDMPKVIDLHKWHFKASYINMVPKAPKYLQIELNNTCNARCQMCTIPNMERKRGFMKDELYDDILKQANELGVSYISPFLHGEPFVRKDFISKVIRINELTPKAKIHIFTNASLLKKSEVNALNEIKNLDLLSFSFPGGTRESYEKITGLNFEQTIKNIKYAIEKLDVPMKITMPLIKENIHTIEDFHQLWYDITANFNKQVDIHSYDTYNYLGDFKKSLARDTDTVCDRILKSMTILWDGRVGLCCMDAEGRYQIGDVMSQSIQEVWNGEIASGYRKRHIHGRQYCEPCNRCNQELLPQLE